MRRTLLVATFALLWSCTLSAQWKEDGAGVPDTSWRKSDGDFGAMLLLTDKSDELFKAWETESPGVLISSALTAKRGSPIVGIVVFTGCLPTERGLCDATVTYTVLKPDGTVYGDRLSGELWTGKSPPPKGQLQLSVAYMGVVIEPGDPAGRYRMLAEVRDLVARKTIHLEQHFDVVEPQH